MKRSKEYREQAWSTLSSYWNDMAVILLVIILIAGLGSGIGLVGTLSHMNSLSMFGSSTSFIAAILLVMPLEFSLCALLLSIVRKEENEVSPMRQLWRGFLDNYTAYVVAGFLMYIVIFLISIVTLCIGGIIFAFAYSMVALVIKDNPELTAREALKKSRYMMRGHKWELFKLYFSFIGWFFVGILTCGIGFLWITPYMNTAIVHFYEDVKAEYEATEQEI